MNGGGVPIIFGKFHELFQLNQLNLKENEESN
jgi:hypothetical protein